MLKVLNYGEKVKILKHDARKCQNIEKKNIKNI